MFSFFTDGLISISSFLKTVDWLIFSCLFYQFGNNETVKCFLFLNTYLLLLTFPLKCSFIASFYNFSQ